MSSIDENIQSANPEHQVDLLVDGELSESARHELLLHLEHEPGGWRRCALAFLEAQCWKAELGQIAPPAANEAAPTKTVALGPIGRRQSWRQHAATLLSIAASFLLALVMGMGLTGNWSGSSSHLPSSSHVEATKADDWEMVNLTSDKPADGHQAATVCVPAQCRDSLDQDMLEHIPDAIPPEMQQAFERSGHRVVQQREIVPVQMKDGRRLVVPVDHIEIHYVGRPSL
jgi:hypothetical protein